MDDSTGAAAASRGRASQGADAGAAARTPQATPRNRWPVVVRSRDASGASAAQAAGGEGGALGVVHVRLLDDEGRHARLAQLVQVGREVGDAGVEDARAARVRLGRELVALGVLEQQADVLVGAGRLVEALGPAQLVARVQHLLAAEGEDLDGRRRARGRPGGERRREAGDLLERRLRRGDHGGRPAPARPAATRGREAVEPLQRVLDDVGDGRAPASSAGRAHVRRRPTAARATPATHGASASKSTSGRRRRTGDAGARSASSERATAAGASPVSTSRQ